MSLYLIEVTAYSDRLPYQASYPIVPSIRDRTSRRFHNSAGAFVERHIVILVSIVFHTIL